MDKSETKESQEEFDRMVQELVLAYQKAGGVILDEEDIDWSKSGTYVFGPIPNEQGRRKLAAATDRYYELNPHLERPEPIVFRDPLYELYKNTKNMIKDIDAKRIFEFGLYVTAGSLIVKGLYDLLN